MSLRKFECTRSDCDNRVFIRIPACPRPGCPAVLGELCDQLKDALERAKKDASPSCQDKIEEARDILYEIDWRVRSSD